MYDEPQYFTLKIGACFCRCDIRVNDIPVLVEDLSGSRVDIEMPLNLHVFTGENTVSFRLAPAQSSEQAPAVALDNGNVECVVELVRRPYGRDTAERTVLASLSFRGGDVDPFGGSSAEVPGVSPVQRAYDPQSHAMAARAVSLVTQFPEWRWVKAPVIEAGQPVLRDLLAEHQRFWNALRAKDVADLRAQMSANAREVQAAYYLRDLDDAWRVIGIEELLRSPDAQLKPMPADLSLDVFANGRLARLVTETGDSPIAFRERDTSLDAYLGAWFCRSATGWVMIR